MQDPTCKMPRGCGTSRTCQAVHRVEQRHDLLRSSSNMASGRLSKADEDKAKLDANCKALGIDLA
jgi:hypothetical protein